MLPLTLSWAVHKVCHAPEVGRGSEMYVTGEGRGPVVRVVTLEKLKKLNLSNYNHLLHLFFGVGRIL